MRRFHRCIYWGIYGFLLGVSISASAQDPGALPEPAMGGFEHLLSGGSLSVVLGWGFFQVYRAFQDVASLIRQDGIPLVIRLSEADRKLLEELAEAKEKRR